MLWTYFRDGVRLHYEIRRALDGEGYEVVVLYPDGREECERLEDAEALDRRAAEMQRELLNAGWFIASDPRR